MTDPDPIPHPTTPPQDSGAPEDPGPAAPASSTWLGVFLATGSTVFLAELGDKTQLAALLLSAQSGRPVVVFVGASLALICSSLVGVLLGRWLSRLMAPEQLERAAGLLMVALGLWLGRQAVLQLTPQLLHGTPLSGDPRPFPGGPGTSQLPRPDSRHSGAAFDRRARSLRIPIQPDPTAPLI